MKSFIIIIIIVIYFLFFHFEFKTEIIQSVYALTRAYTPGLAN